MRWWVNYQHLSRKDTGRTMSRGEFISALEQQLHQDTIPFRREDVLAFVDAAWPQIAGHPDVAHWAVTFRETGAEVPFAGGGEPD